MTRRSFGRSTWKPPAPWTSARLLKRGLTRICARLDRGEEIASAHLTSEAPSAHTAPARKLVIMNEECWVSCGKMQNAYQGKIGPRFDSIETHDSLLKSFRR
jgi:hypothetical protein